MNNKQFILIVCLISVMGGYIGYHVGGVFLLIVMAVTTPAIFLILGD